MTEHHAAARLTATTEFQEFSNIATQALADGSTLAQLLIAACHRYGERIAFTNLGQNLSYAEIERRSADLAAFLRSGFELQAGDRVAIMLPNLLQYPIALLAVLRADLIAVLVNPLYTARELRHQLSDSGAKALIVLDNFGSIAAEAIAGSELRHVVTTRVGDALPWPKSWLVNFALKYLKKMVPAFSIPGAVRWPMALASGARLPRVVANAKPSDIAQLQYTGGTTGVSRGAELAHTAIVANISALEQWVGCELDPPRELGLICLPVYHIAAYTNMLHFWTHGVRGVLITNPRDIAGLVNAFAKYRPTLFSGVNTLYDALLNSTAFRELDFSALRLCVQGATALRRATAERWKTLTGCTVYEMYGLSETSAGITANRLNADNPVGSIGLPLAGVDIRLLDEGAVAVAEGAAGEICVRGPQVTSGYWQKREDTAQVFFADGWFRTGDIARADADGYLFLLDRRKDMILVSGFNVYPNEIEDAVALHPGVLEAAAVGVPDERTGEAVKLVVVRKDPTLDEAAVRAHCRQQLTGYKQPRLIEFHESLPKSAVGKVLRRELR